MYIDLSTNKIVTIAYVRKTFQNLSLPDERDYPELGFRWINEVSQPEALPNHYVVKGLPAEVGGEWYETWEQVEITAIEQETPTEVSRFQARMALHHFGMFETADAYCASEEAPLMVKEAWLSAQVFRRDSPTIESLKTPLSITDEDLDDLFIYASGVSA